MEVGDNPLGNRLDSDGTLADSELYDN